MVPVESQRVLGLVESQRVLGLVDHLVLDGGQVLLLDNNALGDGKQVLELLLDLDRPVVVRIDLPLLFFQSLAKKEKNWR